MAKGRVGTRARAPLLRRCATRNGWARPQRCRAGYLCDNCACAHKYKQVHVRMVGACMHDAHAPRSDTRECTDINYPHTLSPQTSSTCGPDGPLLLR